MGVERPTDEREVEAVARAMHRRDYNQGRARYDWDEMQEGYREDCRRHARAALDAVRGDTVKLADVLAFLRSFTSPASAPNENAPKMWLAADVIEAEFRRSPDAR